jgi:hypothetical protein
MGIEGTLLAIAFIVVCCFVYQDGRKRGVQDEKHSVRMREMYPFLDEMYKKKRGENND